MIGLVATAALILAFFAGFQLGHADERTVVVTQTVSTQPSTETLATEPAEQSSRIQGPVIDYGLQQAYYNNLRVGSWVICVDLAADAHLACQPLGHVVIDGGSAFHPASEHWPMVEPVTLAAGSRMYLMGDLPGRTWIADVAAPYAGSYDQVLGVTLNGSVQYFDLGHLAPGHYVIVSQSTNAFISAGPGDQYVPVTLAAGLIVE
jgi:hypothetical protein